MPTYQYACTKCGHRLEAVQAFSDDPLTQCPACEGRLRKVFSAVGIVFKGSGFYRTDSRADDRAGDRAGDRVGAKETASPTKEKGADSATAGSGTAAKESTAAASSTAGSSSTAAKSA